MSFFTQIFSVAWLSIRTIRERLGSSAVAVVGIAGVVIVFVAVLSIAEGFSRTMQTAGAADRAIIMRGGADSEMTSGLAGDAVEIMKQAPGIRREAQRPAFSPELYVMVDLPKRSTQTPANVPLRGVTEEVLKVRYDAKIVEGQMLTFGTNEIVAGRAAAGQFMGLAVGSTLTTGQATWKVVGIFEAKGSISESELWADAEVLAPAYRRGPTFQTAMVRLASPGSFQQFKDGLTSDPRVSLRIERETDYYAGQSRTLRLIVTGLAFIVCSLMGLGALFGALNTMYTAVAARAREIATLEAIGFGGMAVMVSVILEALFLALVGGLIGAVGAYLAFDGYRTATMNWQTFSQVAFAFDVTPQLMIGAILYALVIGVVGGLFPAIRAARLPVSLALREP